MSLTFISGARIGYVLILLLLFGWAVIPLMYMFSFVFSIASTAYTRMTILNVITGLVTLMVVNILSIPTLDLLNIAHILKWVFMLMPNYCLGEKRIILLIDMVKANLVARLLKVSKHNKKTLGKYWNRSKYIQKSINVKS